jgi:hypothetical protein
MVQGLIIWLLTLLFTYLMVGLLQQRHAVLNKQFILVLFFYHSVLAVAYYIYALNNPSDSIAFFKRAEVSAFGDSWLEYFGVGTQFIYFISYSLIHHFGFTYESCMVFFSWLGYLGFLFFYIFIKERVRSNPKMFVYSSVAILFLLPNLHFWSSSLGKGSLIFFGFGLFFFSLNRPGKRFWGLLLGGWIIFQIRPHIFYVILIAIAVAYTFSTKGVVIGYRILILLIASFLLYFIYEDILRFTGLETESIIDPVISHRASELSKATSGIDINAYTIPEKLFAFWFRPLFFDAPGTLGLIVSFENLFYLIFFARLLRPNGISFLLKSDAVIKTCLITFVGVSFALAQISGNLGLAMRQKSQVMILMLFVIVKFMDDQKIEKIKRAFAMKRQRARLNPKTSTTSGL